MAGSGIGDERALIAISYHADLKEVQGDPVLSGVLGEAARAPFDRLEWWSNLCDSFGYTPLIAVARNERGGVVLPLRRVGHRIEALTCWYTFQVQPLFWGDLDYRNEEHLSLLRALARDLRKQSAHVVLAPLPDNEHSREAHNLAFAFWSAGWLVHREQSDVNHFLIVGGRTYAEYLAARPGQLRTTLARKAKKVTVTIETAFNPRSWAAYEAVYEQSWKPGEGSPVFLRRFAEEEGAAGRLRLGLAFHDGVPVAAQLWTVEHHTALIHKLAHTEASKPLSPGTTLSAALFEYVIDRDKVAGVDFGTGDDPYKRDWMEEVRPRYRIEALDPFSPRAWPRILRRLLRGLARRGQHG
jgi:hypothetical protein